MVQGPLPQAHHDLCKLTRRGNKSSALTHEQLLIIITSMTNGYDGSMMNGESDWE